MINIKITPEESLTMEKSFYQYNASLDIINFLSKQEGINKEFLNEYIHNSELYFHEMEKNKAIIGGKYKPQDGNDYGYKFNFEDCSINYYLPNEEMK